MKLQIDDEIEKHADLLQEIQGNTTDFNVVVARRRRDFTGDFFRHLNILSDTYDSLEDRDGEPPLNFPQSFKMLVFVYVDYLRTANLGNINSIKMRTLSFPVRPRFLIVIKHL